MYKDKDGNIVYNRAELTEDRCRQSKADELTVSRNFLQDLLNNSAKLNKIRIFCEKEDTEHNKKILSIIKEKI